MTILHLPFKLIKIWLYWIISTLLYLSSDWKPRFIRPKIHKTRILPKVGNMTLLPNPGKPGFYGVGLPGRVISCQPWMYMYLLWVTVQPRLCQNLNGNPQKVFSWLAQSTLKLCHRSATQLMKFPCIICGCTAPIVKCILGTLDLENWEGGTLIFSSYVGSDQASTVHPPKNIGNFKHPKKYLKF